MINKDTLKHLTSIGIKNTDIAKKFNVGRILVAQCVNFHGLTNAISKTEYDNEITQMLREVHQFYPNVGHHCAVGHFRVKYVKVKQVRLRLMLKKIL